ncbi:MAG: CehA/McbA family metallohydrolase [Anaerolineae bacterium]|nr:CehA/McbA family metallohydrolase [Anaerolineae bacterium]
MAYSLPMGDRGAREGGPAFHVLRGNLHMHTHLSDGTRSHRELGQIAAGAGLDFIVITDHNVYPPGLDGYVDGTLILVGEEVHDPARALQSSHLLCFDIRSDVARYAADPQAVIDAVSQQGGFTFLAHPFEHDAADFLPEPNISWRDWHVHGYAGIELWNYMSEFKGAIANKLQAILHAYLPALSAQGPYPETLSKWDELLQSRPVAALGGSDAHGTLYHLGPLSREVQPYHYLFRALNTHLLVSEPLTGEIDHDRALIYHALRTSRGFLGNEQIHPIAGFSFWADSGPAFATMGEEIELSERVALHVTSPARAHLRLLRDGQVVAAAHANRLHLVGRHPGIYRVEALRHHAGRRRGWIYSNPIYVR